MNFDLRLTNNKGTHCWYEVIPSQVSFFNLHRTSLHLTLRYLIDHVHVSFIPLHVVSGKDPFRFLLTEFFPYDLQRTLYLSDEKKTQLWSHVDITCRPHQWRGSRLSHSSLRVAEPAYLLPCIWTQWLKRNKLKAHKKKPQLRAGRRLLTAYRLSRCHGGRSIIGFSADLQLLNSCTMVHLPYCVHTCCAYVQHSTCTCKWRCPCVFPRWWTPSRLWKQLRWPFFWFFLCIPLADVSLFFLLLLDLVSYSFAYLVRFLVFILLTEEETTRDSRTTVTTQIYHLLNFDWQPANKIKIKNQAPDKA